MGRMPDDQRMRHVGGKVRDVLPCRIVTSQPEVYAGLAALIGSWGLPTRLAIPAEALADPANEPGVDLVALEGEDGRGGLRQLLARRHAVGVPVVALMRRGRPRLVSLALALGCDDGIAFPLPEDELRLRLESHATYALLARELRLREQVCERWREPIGTPPPGPAGGLVDGLVLLVGPPSPAQVKLVDALPLKRVAFVRSLRTAAARLREESPLLVVVSAETNPTRESGELAALVEAAGRSGVVCLLAAQAAPVSIERAVEAGFADRLATADTPEELRLRLSFWLRVVQVRRGLRARRGIAAGPAVDPLTGLFGRAMLLDYLNRREAYPAGRERAFVVLRLVRSEAQAERAGNLAFDRLVAACGARLGAGLRAEDLAAHLGDGVFCVVLPPSQAPDPGRLAARLQAHLAEPPLAGPDLPPCRVAITTGRLARPADAPRALDRAVRDAAEPALRAA